MRVLVACEFSGIVREEFKKLGHDAWSCDLLPTEIEGNHYQGDILQILGITEDWDLMIAHPPCTYLTIAANIWYKTNPNRYMDRIEAAEFFIKLALADIPRIAIENPIGVMSGFYRSPDQIIQPYEFGDDASKSTCLWLKNLPALIKKKEDYIEPRIINGKKRWGNQTDSGQNKLTPSPTRWMDRSRTYKGIAKAMAEQWGGLNG